MKTIDNTKGKSIVLPFIWCDAIDFLQIVKRISGSDTPFLKVGDYSTSAVYEMEGLEDIQSNIHLIKTPVRVTFSGIVVDIDRSSAHIDYDQESYARARGVAEAFLPYKVFGSSFLSDRHFFIGLVLLVFVSGTYIPDRMKEAQLEISAAALILYFATFYLMSSVLGRNRIYFRPRDNFLKRNQDKIVWSVLTFIGTVFISRWTDILQFITTHLK